MNYSRNDLKIVLISGPLVGQKNDPFSAIPSIPTAVPYLSAYLRDMGIHVQCIDAFGLAPEKKTPFLSRFILNGLLPHEIVARIEKDVDLIGISVHSGGCHTAALQTITLCKKTLQVPIIVGGHQATHLYKDFLSNGADFVVLGEGEPGLHGLIQYFRGEQKLTDIKGIAYKDKYQPHQKSQKDLNGYPFPDYDAIPLERYWRLGLAHGPFYKGSKYLPLITSRGCTFSCNFCASSTFWLRQWRPRDPQNIIEEIKFFRDKYKVSSFQIQDPNFSSSKQRVVDFAKALRQQRVQINWSLPSGIKLDGLDKETMLEIKSAGCTYFNFSPEHASSNVLNKMNKPIDLDLMIDLIRYSDEIGLKKGACFILGYYNETHQDIDKIKIYLRKLIKAGLDEVSFYIFCPVPGSSDFHSRMLPGMDCYEGLCWSPRWRKDYKVYNTIRIRLYLYFLFYKSLMFPFRMLKSVLNLFSGKFELKSEMIIARFLRL